MSWGLLSLYQMSTRKKKLFPENRAQLGCKADNVTITLSIEKCVFFRRLGATTLPSDFLLYLNSSLGTAIKVPALYKLLTFHNPNFV
jgi:hypothetical protein